MDTLEALVRLAWLVGAAAFVIGLMRMNSPATARTGNWLSAGGMTLAIAGTAVLLVVNGSVGGIGWLIIAAGVALGGGLGLYTARTVKMTAMPQLVSLFNAVGGGAAALIAIDDYLRLANVQTFAPGSRSRSRSPSRRSSTSSSARSPSPARSSRRASSWGSSRASRSRSRAASS